MPGPVSDSYDPEFGTGANAEDVRMAIDGVVDKINKKLGPELMEIVGVVHGCHGARSQFSLSEREMRIVRFSLNRALETI